MVMTVLVLLGVTPLVLAAVVAFAVLVLRWARKNRARAAEMMTGAYLETLNGVEPDPADEGVIGRFVDWLGAKVDDLADGSHAASHDAGHGADAAAYDGGHHASSDCGSSDGGVCGGD